MRWHSLQNIETALKFLEQKNVKVVNIRPVDIFDGNPKLCLGLIWTIILHFQVSRHCTYLIFPSKMTVQVTTIMTMSSHWYFNYSERWKKSKNLFKFLWKKEKTFETRIWNGQGAMWQIKKFRLQLSNVIAALKSQRVCL